MSRVLFVCNHERRECAAAGDALRRSLEDRGLDVVEPEAGTRPEDVDHVVLLGGDGFLIDFLHRHEFPSTPIFGVNFGTVGFLMNPHEEIDRVPDMIRDRRYSSFPHVILEAEAELEDGRRVRLCGFNEVMLERQSGQSVRLSVLIDDEPFNRFAGDGFVISTPAGSTAYNLAAGGPVVHPAVDGIVLTPLYPHRAEPFHSVQFSVILPLDKKLSAISDEGSKRHMRLVVDGRPVDGVGGVTVRDSGKRVTLLRSLERGFLRALRQKFVGEKEKG